MPDGFAFPSLKVTRGRFWSLFKNWIKKYHCFTDFFWAGIDQSITLKPSVNGVTIIEKTGQILEFDGSSTCRFLNRGEDCLYLIVNIIFITAFFAGL